MANFPRSGWSLDHIGHAVNKLQNAESLYIESLGFVLETRERLADQRVDVSFLRSGNFLLELIAPMEGNHNLQKFLTKRGPGLHHICYRVASVNEELKNLGEAGWKLIDQQPRKGSRDLWIAFIHPDSTGGVLTEISSIGF